MTNENIQGLRNELLFKLNEVGNYETHKELWDAFYRYEEALSIANVVGQSEQLLAFKEWERDKCRLPWDAEPKEIVEQYLSQ